MCLRRKHLSGKSIADIRLAVALPARLSLLYLLATCAGSLLAEQLTSISLNRDLTVEQYDYREWSMEDGLPSDQIADIVQTQDGYLWLATENGLARFDGVKFTTFNRSNTPALVTNKITTLFESRDGTLWIGTLRGGLVRCRPSHPPEFQRFEQLQGFAIHCLCEDRSGTLWIGTDVETWTHSDEKCEPSRDAPLNVMAMCEDEESRLWLGASIWVGSSPESLLSSEVQPQPALVRVDEDRFYQLTEADGFPLSEAGSSVRSLCSDPEGGIWIGTAGEGLLRYRNGKCERHLGAGRQAKRYVDIHRSRGGALWVATWATGFHRMENGNTARVRVGLRPVRCIAEGRDGEIWFGGSQRGLRCISNPELIKVRLGIHADAVRALVEDFAGDLWFGSGGSRPTDENRMGLHRLRDGNLENFGREDGLPTHQVTGLALGPDGRLWIGTHKGLACRDLDGSLTTFTTADGLGRDWIRAVYADRAGVVWVGFWEGSLQRMEQGEFTTVAEFGDADVNWCHEDSGGVLWIGSNRGLYRWRNDRLERVSDSVLDELPTITFSACYEDDEGRLWLGTDGGGLCRYAGGRFSNWTSGHGLREDVIHVIQGDERGQLWLGGEHGLTSLPMQSLGALEAGSIDRLEVREHKIAGRFGPDYRPKVLRRKDGSMWFNTTADVVLVPSGGPYHHPLPPLVHIEDIHVDGEPIGTNTAIDITSAALRVELHYTANTFAAPERARFRYRLFGFDNGWIDAGYQRSAYYTGLRPGAYEFRVIAENGHGVWNEEGDSIQLTVRPRFWETSWFRAGSVTAVLLSLVSYFRFRARHIRRRNTELRREITVRQQAETALRQREHQLLNLSGRLIGAQEEERRRIARELHDDLSQRLAVLAIETDSLGVELDGVDGAIEKVQHLKEEIVGVSRDVHALSHELHPSILDDLGLVDALKSQCDQVSRRGEVVVRFEHHDIPTSLSKDVSLCLYRITQECLRNVVKHGRTDAANVSLVAGAEQLTLTITDTGAGFDCEQARRQVGLGLASMEERARLVGGELSIQSQPGEGTEITVRILLKKVQ